MRNLPLITQKVLREFWAVTPTTHQAIIDALESHLSGIHAEPVIMAEDEETAPDSEPWEDNGLMVIPVFGVLGKHLSMMEMECGGCSMDKLSAILDVADKSPRISKVLLHFNSPGGTVTGTPELARKIAAMSRPVISFTDSDCCSGALWLASQAGYFYGTQSSNIGSVGVRMILLDQTKALEEDGVKVNAISSGKFKLSGAAFKPLTDEEREMFQAECDRWHAEFKEAITANRKVDAQYMEGQIYRGDEAAKIGFTDGVVEDLDEAIRLAHSIQ